MHISDEYRAYLQGFMGVEKPTYNPPRSHEDTSVRYVRCMLATALGMVDRVRGDFAGPVGKALDRRITALMTADTT